MTESTFNANDTDGQNEEPSRARTEVTLPSGKGLTFSEGDAITRRSHSRVVLLAGTAKSGKTTLLSSLYLLFHRKPIVGYLFAGCETFVGFEERNYYVEILSGLARPTMERTVVSELLHLSLRNEDGSQLAD